MNKYFAVIFLSLSCFVKAEDSLVLNAGTTGYGGIHLAHNYGVASINANPGLAMIDPSVELSEVQLSINEKYHPNKSGKLKKDSQFFFGGYKANNNSLLGMAYYQPGRNQIYNDLDNQKAYLIERETLNIFMAKHWLGAGFGVNIGIDMSTLEDDSEVIGKGTPVELSLAIPLLNQQMNFFNTALFVDVNLAAKYSQELTSSDRLKGRPTLKPETSSAGIAIDILHGNNSLSWLLTLAADHHISKYSAFNEKPFWFTADNFLPELELEINNYGSNLTFFDVTPQGFDVTLSYGCIVYKGDAEEKFSTAGIGLSGDVISLDISVHESFLVEDELETQIALSASF